MATRNRKSVADITAQMARIRKLSQDLEQRNAMRAGNAMKSYEDYVRRHVELHNRTKNATKIANKYRDNIFEKTHSMTEKASYSTRAAIHG